MSSQEITTKGYNSFPLEKPWKHMSEGIREPSLKGCNGWTEQWAEPPRQESTVHIKMEVWKSLVYLRLKLGFRTGVKSRYVSFKESQVEEMAGDEELTAGWNHVPYAYLGILILWW